MSFNDIFGGNTIYPADPTYLALALSANTTLQWPVEQNLAGTTVIAAIMDVTPSAGGLSITLPDARLGSNGYVTTFYNAGASTFTVKDNAGGTVLTVASGEAWNVYLRANTTAAGLWRIFQMGAGTSTTNAATLAGAGLVAITTTLNEEMITSNHAGNYAILDADRANIQAWTGGTGTFTLPNPATVGAGWFVPIKNNGTGSLTVLPSAGTIDGSGSVILATLESAFFVSNGANFFTIGLGQEVNSVFDFTSIDVSGTGDYTLTGAQLNRVSYEFTGTLTGNRNIIVPASVQQYWVDNETSGAFTLTVKTLAGTGVVVNPTQRRILYCDGTNVIAAETFIVSTPVGVTQGGTGLITVAQGDLLYGSATDTYSLLSKSATATRYLSNTGTNNNPAWGQVNLTNGVTGTLPVGNGGTGLTTYAQGDLIYASAANVLSSLAKDTNATRYLSNTGGSNAPAWAQVSLTTGVTGTLPIANGGTGQTSANNALNALLPSQTTNGGKFLTTDGTNTSWAALPGSASGGTINVAAGTYWDYNLFIAMGSPAGAGTYNLNIPAGAVFRSSGNRAYAIDTSGFTAGSTINIVNLGYIIGVGGRGGKGGSGQAVGDDNFAYAGFDGEDGGTAIQGPGAGRTLNVTNAGAFIWGGGGGGGGGGLSMDDGNNVANGGGGGGGAGCGFGGDPGLLVYAEGVTPSPGTRGQNGAFLYDGSDSKGTGGAGANSGSASGGEGGNGGDFGANGSNGTAPTGFAIDIAAGTGGTAGKAINVNGATVNILSGSGSPNIKGAVS